jgi:hypothetical protein
MDILLGTVREYRRNPEHELISDEEEVPLANRMRMWEQDERERMNQEHELRFASSHVDVGGGDVQRLEWLRMNLAGMADDGSSRQLGASRLSMDVDCQ